MNTMIPKLRFPEFQETGDWEKKLLKDLAKVSTLKNKDKKLNRVLTNSAIDGIVDQREFFEKDIANKNNLEGYYVVEFGDYVYNPRVSLLAPVGPISKNKVGIGIMSPLYTVFRFFNRENDFFEHYFKTVHWHSYMRSIANDGARHDRMAIKIEEFIELPLPHPSLKEQQKIASTLSSLDDLITAQSEKIKALQTHKKSMMQQLFPAEGERVPRLRFPEFWGAGDWEEKLLGEKTIKVGSGITPKGGDKTYKKEGRPFVRSQNVGWGYLILNDISYIDEKTHSTFSSTEIMRGDVLLNITGASIGRSALADLNIIGGNVNQHVCIIRTKKELYSLFLNQYLLSNYGQNQIDSFQAGGNRQGLNFAQIRSLSIPFPPSFAEQQKIAATLSSLDDLIKTQNQKLEALKKHKRGLMQQLFPNPIEETV